MAGLSKTTFVDKLKRFSPESLFRRKTLNANEARIGEESFGDAEITVERNTSDPLTLQQVVATCIVYILAMQLRFAMSLITT